MVSLANISHISACHCNSRRIYESGGAKQAAEQFALSSVLMGLKIMFLFLDLLLNSKCEISSILLPSFIFLLGGKTKRKVSLSTWRFQSLLLTQTL